MFDNVLAQGPHKPASEVSPAKPVHLAFGVASLAAGAGALLCAVLMDWSYNVILAWPVSIALGVAQLVFVWRAWRREQSASSGTSLAVLALAVGGLLLNVIAFFWASSHAHGC
ncbi:hypothetical protein FGE12_05680 [Aggregicoccus sp. 17bor-14]|uniref:hypothetical protein n=1 Tax=Myxococcaceae TaxID=31 RepID=UPI00129C9E29|nr:MULTISPECIES: hypothetical protein [Myxococcaceae]MBF5041873.1 hypothetical protein [Simulacricoccus sp. 17bor-14]MRI87654.1 hypothetical protein [Aggregicoccus sp. 17bor-14]